MSVSEKQQWAKSRVEYWWNRCLEAFPEVQYQRFPWWKRFPTVEFSNRMSKAAGKANTGLHRIRFSNHFLTNESKSDFDQTIGHEVAHIFADRLFNRACKHGKFWRLVMTRIGLPPDRCHSYASTPPRKRRASTIVVNCPCGQANWPIGKKKQDQLLSLQISDTKIARCRKCGHDFTLGEVITSISEQLA